jgi:hypothetical protein
MADFDSPWKDALDLYFRPFLALFFPPIHRDVHWSRGYEMLDKELQQLLPKAAQGRRTVDKLVKVWRKNGAEAWVLIHVEVQTHRERGFGRRMFVYNCRIADRYNREVVSLAVLADDDPGWRPDSYDWELWGCRKRMEFLPVKLLDYAGRQEELEESRNPFAKVVLAHLQALATRRDPEGRREWKFRLVRGLYERGFRAEQVRQLFRLIDWLMELPPALDERFWEDVKAYQEEQTMPFVSTPERYGRKLGMLESIESVLLARFGEAGAALLPEIKALGTPDKFQAVLKVIATANSLDEVQRACAKAAEPPPAPRPRKKGANGKRRRS